MDLPLYLKELFRLDPRFAVSGGPGRRLLELAVPLARHGPDRAPVALHDYPAEYDRQLELVHVADAGDEFEKRPDAPVRVIHVRNRRRRAERNHDGGLDDRRPADDPAVPRDAEEYRKWRRPWRAERVKELQD